MELLGIKMSIEEFDHLMCEQANGKELVVKNGKVVAIEHIQTKEERVATLKQLLSNTDYKAIKYAEGLISEAEYKSIKEQRQAWRDEINQLESEL